MLLVVKATDHQKAILTALPWAENLQIQWYEEGLDCSKASAIIDCCFEEDGWIFHQEKIFPFL